MSEQTIDVVKGSAKVTTFVSYGVPTAATEGASVGKTRFRPTEGFRLAAEEGGTRSLNPYWDISIYTQEEINAIREADKLDPDLAEHYKDLLED
jgi:hypothetical protein